MTPDESYTTPSPASVPHSGYSPLSVDEMRDRLAWLMGEIQHIDAQIGDRDRRNPETGERVTGPEYFQWRRKALFAKTKLLEEYRALKTSLKTSARTAQTNGGAERRQLVNEVIAAARAWFESGTHSDSEADRRLYMAVGSFEAFIAEEDDADQESPGWQGGA